MQEQQVLEHIKQLLKANRITLQQYRTYRGQINSGHSAECIVGLERRKLWGDNNEKGRVD